MRRLFSRLMHRLSPPPVPRSTREYWEQRARRFGKRSVLNLDHSKDEYDSVTDLQITEIFPCLREVLDGTEKVVLDVGCGPGRFTPHLASLVGGTAVGIDPIRELLDLAPPSPDVEYRQMVDDVFPVEDASIDLVWICLVLGGLRGKELEKTVTEIDRVLKPGGLLFLIENTSPGESVPHWEYRSYEAYREMFPFVELRYHKDYMDLYERHTVMSGRKSV